MYVSDCLQINDQGELTIGGISAVSLAKEYGTPLYVMDEDEIRRTCGIYRDAIQKYYEGKGMALYASKAFCCKQMCSITKEEGLGLDVVSGGELYTALHADFPAERIYFHGNNKTPEELEMAVVNKIGCVVVDNADELYMLNDICKKHGEKMNVMFRIKPSVEAHTHDFIRTGQLDSKFGVALEGGEAFSIIKEALTLTHIYPVGIHCHIGSQIFDLAPFELAAERMMGLIVRVKKELDFTVEQLNLGGGFGIRYEESDDPVPYDEYIRAVSVVVKRIAAENDLPTPYILMEPGRSVVAPAGITLYTVGTIKEIPGIRNYLSVDGGMGDNPRYILYGARYDALLANKAGEPKTETYTIAGKCCESGDLIGEDMPLQKAEPGDTLCVLATGAYNHSMSSNYNRIPKPGVVMVRNGESRMVVRRENYEDLVRNDL